MKEVGSVQFEILIEGFTRAFELENRGIARDKFEESTMGVSINAIFLGGRRSNHDYRINIIFRLVTKFPAMIR